LVGGKRLAAAAEVLAVPWLSAVSGATFPAVLLSEVTAALMCRDAGPFILIRDSSFRRRCE
jgi:hypothetical protein